MAVDPETSAQPPLPPTTEEDRLNRLRLLRSRRVGISTYYRLMAEHGSADAALRALPDIARGAGVSGYEICPQPVVLAEMKRARAARARMIFRGSADYPAALEDLADAPPILWARGDLSLIGRPALALVGARNASSLGTRMAKSLAGELGKSGHVIVSGLARGIDTAAHLAALETGTIAVMAGGVDVTYPAENAGLADDIVRQGLLLSEMQMGLQPQARHFPRRNRLVSGLARAVIVIEAAARSGSLITARNALDQGREVMAVPGHPFDGRASGCNMLIRDGAMLVRGADDILEALPETEHRMAPELPLEASPPSTDSTPVSPKANLRETAALHRSILSLLGPAPVAEDQLIRDVGRRSQDVSPALLDLELECRIERQPGGLIALRDN